VWKRKEAFIEVKKEKIIMPKGCEIEEVGDNYPIPCRFSSVRLN
jgi:hypothetical protein